MQPEQRSSVDSDSPKFSRGDVAVISLIFALLRLKHRVSHQTALDQTQLYLENHQTTADITKPLPPTDKKWWQVLK